MKRRFNITGSCNPQRHYMVSLDDRLKKIKEDYVDYGSYFVINRGRQYGKTTTLEALRRYLKDDYTVLPLDFQQMGREDFADAVTFVQAFSKKLCKAFEHVQAKDKEKLQGMLSDFRNNSPDAKMGDLFECLGSLCKASLCPIVLMINEVDSASNNQVFIDFLSQLRSYYLKRDEIPTFHSVILAGVYDIKNLKLKLRTESEHQYNSPWNIAAKFKIDMSFSPVQIASMLDEYENDHHTGMDVQAIANVIYQYTSGYPVLVSSICKCIDEELPDEEKSEDLSRLWTQEGIAKAVTIILKESSTLFEHMTKQLDTYEDLYKIVEDIIYCGKRIPFSPEEKSIHIGTMFGFLKEENGHVAIANRMFEMCLLNMFMAKESINSEVYAQGGSDRIGFINNNMLDMDFVSIPKADYQRHRKLLCSALTLTKTRKWE